MRLKRDKKSQGYRLTSWLFALLVVVLSLMGGSSRYDATSLLVLRPLLVLLTAGLLFLPSGDLARAARGPGLLLLLLGVLITAQLVPLPPTIWTQLPGRASYIEVANWIGRPQPWRPLSIVPVLTENSLLALLPAVAAVVALSRLSMRDLGFVIAVLLGCGTASALLGVLQVGGGAAGLGYLYANPSVGLPTGLFSNRNHQAAFLAGLLPILAVWATSQGKIIPAQARHVLAGLGATLFVLTVLITGSRSGLLLTGLNLAGAAWLFLRASPVSGRARWLIVGLVALLALLIIAAVALGRGGGIARLAALDAGADMRVRALPVLRELAKDYFPWGTGFGTFDPVFRIYEPDQLLKRSYFNNAHNDLIELTITGGLPALLLLASLLGWLAWRAVSAVRAWAMAGASRSAGLPVAALMGVITWLLASLSDYPLRTPLAGALFALACCLLSASGWRRGQSL